MSHRPEAAGDSTDHFARPEPIHLSHEDIGAIAAAVSPAVAQAVAERVVELLDERQANDLVDAGDLARVLGVDREWVYEHADQLGAIRLGEGPRPRLRLEVGRAVASFRALSAKRRVVPFVGDRIRRFRVRAAHRKGAADRTRTPLPTAVRAGCSRPVQRQ